MTATGAKTTVKRPAPDFTLEKVSGKSSNLTDARAGKKAIIFFWATWCPHCHEELGKLNAALSSVESKGIKVLLVDVGESREEVSAYLEHAQIQLDSFLDEENALQDPYGLIGVPTVVFVDEQGLIKDTLYEFPADYENHF